MTEGNKDSQFVPEPFKAGYETYLSPYTFRYGSEEMRNIWSRNNFWLGVRDIWIAAAEVLEDHGVVKKEQVNDLKKHRLILSIERIDEIEKEKGHDVVAAIQEFSEVAPLGGEIIHHGFTSEDVLSNVEVKQIDESFSLIRERLVGTLSVFGEKIDEYKDLPTMGFTHLQAAEPTTVGYRLAKYAQDLLIDLQIMDTLKGFIKGKGIKGPVGTSGSFTKIFEDIDLTPDLFERKVMEKFGLDFVTISDQTYPRKFLFVTEFLLANIGLSLHRFALDMQILQSSPIDELSEPFKKGQKGSSAMPHKKNPINTENIDSITEDLPGKLMSSWMSAAFVTLERTLRDSAGKRSYLPESFLIVDEALKRTEKVVKGLIVRENSINSNLARFAPFSATEPLLAELTNRGMDRKEAHDILVGHAEIAVEAKRNGLPNPMKELVLSDKKIYGLMTNDEIENIFSDVSFHIGNAPEKCESFLKNELYPAIRK